MASKEPKTARIDARMPESVHLLLVRAAELQGRTLSDFVVCSARQAAEQTIAKHQIILLSVSDQKRFADALQNPPPASDALRRAAAYHENLIDMSKRQFVIDLSRIVVLVACVLVTGQAFAADASAILEQANKTYANFDTVKYRADCRCRVVGQPSKSLKQIRLHRHFDLLDIKSLSFHDEKDETSVRFNRNTFGPRFGVAYQTSGHLNEVEELVPKTGFVSDNDRELKRLSLLTFMVQYGGWLDGYLGMDQHRLPEIVAKSNPRIVKDEVVDGVRLIEIEATTRYGRVSIWVSPEEGCLIRRGIVRKSGNDIMVLNRRFDSPQNPMSPLENPLTSWIGEFSVDSVSKRDGGWVADSGTATISQVHADGEKFARACQIVRKDVDLKPEFTAHTFESDLPAGTLTVFTDRPDSEFKYSWDGIQPILLIPEVP